VSQCFTVVLYLCLVEMQMLQMLLITLWTKMWKLFLGLNQIYERLYVGNVGWVWSLTIDLQVWYVKLHTVSCYTFSSETEGQFCLLFAVTYTHKDGKKLLNLILYSFCRTD
jgi:hypothetical protein